MKKNEIFLFVLWFVVFFILIFLINITFFYDKNNDEYEETINKYEWIEEIETWSLNTAKDYTNIDTETEKNQEVDKRYEEIISQYKTSIEEKETQINIEKEVNYNFSPDSLKTDLLKTNKLVKIYSLFNSSKIPNNISLKVNFFKDLWKTRWNYKENSIRLFWVNDLSNKELFAVLVHEFWHYFDMDFFTKKILNDKSNDFYNISWEQTKVLKWWQSISDFVSGYAMTNKYEDFSESFIYYVIHNWDFLEKSKNSELLKLKYDFFSENLFTSWEFKNTNFTNWKLLDYYRDTTKIDYFFENLLNYLEK